MRNELSESELTDLAQFCSEHEVAVESTDLASDISQMMKYFWSLKTIARSLAINITGNIDTGRE